MSGQIVAKFPGRCPRCKKPIRVGELIARVNGKWDVEGWFHVDCAKAIEQAQEEFIKGLREHFEKV